MLKGVEIQPMWKAFSALPRNSNVKLVTSLDILLVFVIKRNKHRSSLEDKALISCKQEQCMHVRMPHAAILKRVPVMILFVVTQSTAHTSQFQEDSKPISPDYKPCLQVETSSYKESVS